MPPSGGDRKAPKRRVPDSLRRRNPVSCDRCKLRRIRCMRANENESCASCFGHGVECKSTMPRKQRLYGSVEKLSVRYRALDALVRGLFPDEDTDQVEVLFKLARDRNILMPSPDDETLAPEAFSQTSPPAAAVSSQPDADEPPENKAHDFLQDPVQERMIPGPHRILQYVGPSSTSDFASIIRQLVAKLNWAALESRERERERCTVKQATGNRALLGRKQEPQAKHEPEPPTSEKQSSDENPIPGETTLRQLLIASLPYRPGPDSDTAPSSVLKDLLPQRKQCDSLVEAYFNNIHSTFQVFHRVSFMRQYESLWRVGALKAQEPGVGWICSLFMVIILGANFLGEEQCPDSLSIQNKYFKLIRERIDSIAFTASLENVQALLLLQLYEHNSGERNTAWLFLGLAGRMAITIGMHREGTYKNFGSTESHTRRIVWWTLFHFDQSIAAILARPTIIDNKEVNVRQPDDSVVDGAGFPEGFGEQIWVLVDITARVKRLAASISARYADETALLSSAVHVNQLLQELDAWKARLPPQLDPESPGIPEQHRRTVILLNAIYYHYKSVVTRPFLVCKVNHQVDCFLRGDKSPTLSPASSTTEMMSRECQNSATAVLDCFLRLSRLGLLEGVAWTDFYYICHSILATSMGALGRQSDVPLDAENEKIKSKISAFIEIAQTMKVAPTYKVFCEVAFALANSVGLGIEDNPPEANATNKEVKIPAPLDSFGHLNSPSGPFSDPSYSGMFTFPPQQPVNSAMFPQGLLNWSLSGEMDVDWSLWNLGNNGVDYVGYNTTLQYPGAYDPTERFNWPS
ncbi:hypothetical protein PISL3812_03041 [Talaromyces islandicus]|uniref:Zn(2)-C6 fungal-type domain-containing protein n=1 Tax=Talaromyces islandicus TaxID=28573 RepID=A0A0U1LRN5_TALIS|nr:hypothetical protein PISL3812_03041 [Talaromyces islandicus]